MLGIHRYLFRQLLIALLFIAVTLTCAIWLTQSMQFIRLILNRGLALGDFLHLTVLLMPSFLLIVLPMALFFSVLFNFNKMLNDRELVILRNAGISPLGIAKPVILIATGVVAICYFISLYLMPVSFQEFRRLQVDIRNNATTALLQPGVFRTMGSDLTIYVRARDGDQIRGILVQDDRNAETSMTLTAERGSIVTAEDGPRVLLFNGTRQERNRTTGEMSVLYFDRYSFDITFLALEQSGPWQEPNERFVGNLLNPDMNSPDRHYVTQLVAAGHNRLTAPLYTYSFVLIAVACLLHGQFNKRGQNRRLGLAVALGGALYGGALGIYGMASKDNSWIPFMYVASILPAFATIGFLMWGRRNPVPIASLRPSAAE